MLTSSMILMIFIMMMTFSDKDFCTICTVMLLIGRTICTYRIYIVIQNIRINPLNDELNPTCHLLALLGAHHILQVSRIRVKDTCVHCKKNPAGDLDVCML